ncbi:MAG: ferrous iron transport protein A [Deltaproteobacteria bacterium]|nr:ferrous iron transport protein A [Deltaproteobacteria bacterium]
MNRKANLPDSGAGEKNTLRTIVLRQMQKNQTGTIKSISATGDLGRRIRELGLIPGTVVTMHGKAPLKDPVALRVMGGTLTLRNNEADTIFMEVD